MITSPETNIVLSSLGWVDGATLWCLDTDGERTSSINLDSKASYVSLHTGGGEFFSVLHHFDSGYLEISAHSFQRPNQAISKIIIDKDLRKIDGDKTIWEQLPSHYVAYLAQSTWSDFGLISINDGSDVTLQSFEWYDDQYDKGYQGIVGVAEDPRSGRVIVSVQRSSTLILYDPAERKKTGEITLSEQAGNPRLYFGRKVEGLWADDYDTLVRLDPADWTVKVRRKLQKESKGSAQFIGSFNFSVDEDICIVPRPFSGDVLGIDPFSLKTKYKCKTGGQPLEAIKLGDGRVFAREWKTGELLSGRLKRAWVG